jgi:hypothetical protein
MTTVRTGDKVVYTLIKRGKPKVVRIVREQYLRKDIDSFECENFKLLSKERNTGEIYFVLDFDVTKSFLELFETPELKNIIFLQTIVFELKDHSFSLYNRLRKKTNDLRHNSFVFSNESFDLTKFVSNSELSKTEKIEESILKAFFWLTTKLNCTIISNSESILNKCNKQGLNAMNLISFLKIYHRDNIPLHDLYYSLETVVQEKLARVTGEFKKLMLKIMKERLMDILDIILKKSWMLESSLETSLEENSQ